MGKITGAEYIARTLESYGVTTVFLVPTILSRTLYEMERHTSIARIVTHGEKAAVYMADGYARASGRPGVCMAQNVGAANLAAGLRDPYLGCSPVVALTGGPYEWSRGRNYYQEIEDFPLFKPVTKLSAAVNHVSRLPDLLSQAFRAAILAKPRPTHLELAGHTGDLIEDEEVVAEIPADGPVSLPAMRVAPDPSTVKAAAEMLRASRRPVVVAGGGVRAAGAGAEVVALAELLGMPIATSLNGKDTVPGDHPLSVGVPGLYPRASANQLLLEADLVFYVGSQTGSQVTLMWRVPPLGTRVLQLDVEASELGRHYPGTLGLLGDAKTGLVQLIVALGDVDARPRDSWVDRARQLAQRWREEVGPQVVSDQVPIRPERLCGELTRHLPGDALLVSDTGHAGMWTGGYVDLKDPRQGYIRAAGSLGWGLPAALGAQVAQPRRPVVLFTGDGGLWYHLSELETAARWRIPAVIVVNNNHSLNQEIGPYTEAYGGSLHGRHSELWHFQDLDLARIAESMGVAGLTVTKPSELGSAIDRALESRGPVLVNVVTDIDAVAPKGSAEPAQP
ncbi:MAG: thiamine pyrophosphate-binding protein [Acidimicrobiales bacterium]